MVGANGQLGAVAGPFDAQRGARQHAGAESKPSTAGAKAGVLDGAALGAIDDFELRLHATADLLLGDRIARRSYGHSNTAVDVGDLGRGALDG
mgnify:CR=1 FL=1